MKSLKFILVNTGCLILLFTVAIIIYNEGGEAGRCELDNRYCDIDTAAGKVSLNLDTIARPEEQISFTLSTPASAIVTDITLKGDDMYMGKVPVFIKSNQDNMLEGWFMLGSCSQPTMRWRMLITIEGLDDPLIVYFNSTAG